MFAERTLTIKSQELQSVSIEIDAPAIGEKGEYTCSFSIGWPKGIRSEIASGYDGFQAILLAMNMIAANLYTSEYHRAGQLFWDQPGNGYGFPVSKVLRDLAQGDDKTL